MENRDYTLIIDQSGSMSAADQPGGKTRWQAVQECTLALAKKCAEFDPDGIAVYFFSSRFKRYDNVTEDKVDAIFQGNILGGTTNLASVLQDAVKNYFQRKTVAQAKLSGETIFVITDGEPDDRMAVADVIVNASRQMEREEELAISLIQVGSDSKVTRSLKSFDDQLQGLGAKFDIVDTITLEDMQDMSLTDVLINAIAD